MEIIYGIVDGDVEFVNGKKSNVESMIKSMDGVVLLKGKVPDYMDGDTVKRVYADFSAALAKIKKVGHTIVASNGKINVCYPFSKKNVSLDSFLQDCQIFSEEGMKNEKILNTPQLNTMAAKA